MNSQLNKKYVKEETFPFPESPMALSICYHSDGIFSISAARSEYRLQVVYDQAIVRENLDLGSREMSRLNRGQVFESDEVRYFEELERYRVKSIFVKGWISDRLRHFSYGAQNQSARPLGEKVVEVISQKLQSAEPTTLLYEYKCNLAESTNIRDEKLELNLSEGWRQLPFEGTPSATSGSGFGNFSFPTQQPAGGGIFGSQPNGGFAFQQTPRGIFGNQPAGGFGAQHTTGAFGTQQPSGGLFGSQPTTGAFGTQQPSGGLFGSQQTTGAFGTQQPSGGLFGSQQTTGAFGTQQPSGGLFGSQQTTGAVGAQQPTGGLFGSQQTTTGTLGTQQSSGGLFGSQQTTGPVGTQHSTGAGGSQTSFSQQSNGVSSQPISAVEKDKGRVTFGNPQKTGAPATQSFSSSGDEVSLADMLIKLNTERCDNDMSDRQYAAARSKILKEYITF